LRNPPRRGALAGGYRLRTAAAAPRVAIAAMGAVVGEALAAADELEAAGVATDVICLTSADLVFRAWRARQGLAGGGRSGQAILDALLGPARRAPLVTVLDGHPHTLAFLGAVQDVPIACLGVDDFGQSGDVQDLYRHFGIDADTIAGAATDLLA
jgi:pyruvate dehydrogenase E1 component